MTVQDCISEALLIRDVVVLNKVLFDIAGVLCQQPHSSERKSQPHYSLHRKGSELKRVGRFWFWCFAALVGEELVLEAVELLEGLLVCYLHCDLIEVRLYIVWK